MGNIVEKFYWREGRVRREGLGEVRGEGEGMCCVHARVCVHVCERVRK